MAVSVTSPMRRSAMIRRRRLAAVAAVLAVVLLAACTNDSNGNGTAPAPQAATGDPTNLKGVCPDPIVFQKDWQPESEHGFLYNLVGKGYEVDTDKKKVTGPLVAQSKDTGVKIEIRTGGPAVGFQPVPQVMYSDPSIHLGFVATDEGVQFSQKQPTIAVFGQMDISPLAIIWDPATYPQFNIIADIGQTDTKVLYTKGLSYMEYLVGSGILRRSQLDGSYDGSPALFVQSGGKAAFQGFATSEPYLYEHEIKQWGKPLKYSLVNDAGFNTYFSAVSIRAADKAKLAPCLEKLVPIVQRAQVDYLANPAATNKFVVDLVKQYNTGWVYSEGLANYAIEKMRSDFVKNGSDQTLGNLDNARLQRMIEIVTPIFTAQNQPPKSGLKPEDIATNEFIDTSIGVPA